ncbi:MAG: ABC transporter permease [Bacillota bacterium]|nr:ABC transporter permease [Bacillota bacterium]
MRAISAVLNLLRKDLRTVYRDRFLLLMVVLPFAQAWVLRVLVFVGPRYVPVPVPVAEIALYFAPLVVMVAPFMLGFVAGLGLIEERSSRTWLSMRVMPLAPYTYVLYQSGFTTSFAVVLNLGAVLLYGVRPANPGWLVLMTVLMSMSGAIVAFLLGSLAGSQVEGMAIGKPLGIVMATSLAVFAVAPGWQLLVGWSPWYWGYLGLLYSFAGPAVAELGLLKWPGYPPGAVAAATLLLSVILTAALARVYAGRAD